MNIPYLVRQDIQNRATLQQQQHGLEMQNVINRAAQETLEHHRMYGDEALAQSTRLALARGADPEFFRQVAMSLYHGGQTATAALHDALLPQRQGDA